MRVLVTGGAGFLGRHFVQAHLAEHDQVTCIDDFSGTDIETVPQDVLDVTESIDVLAWLDREGGQYDLAYHFAAPVGGRMKIETDPLFNAHSLAIDSTFFRWATLHVKRAVYPSSSAVYGRNQQDSDDSAPLTETMFNPDSLTWDAPDEMYGFTKLAGEMLAWKAAKYGLNTLCIRPFSGYGEGQSFDYPVPSIAARALRREDPLRIWGSGHQTRDFIHVSDLVEGTQARLAYPLRGYDSLNLGSGWPISFRTVAEICSELVGYAPQIVTDESKPEGVHKRFADTTRMSIYHPIKVGLSEGLSRVLEDVENRIGVAVP